MRFLTIAFRILVGLGGCSSDSVSELTEDQSRCEDLDEASCRLDGFCQQAYVGDPRNGLFALKCLQIEGTALTINACTSLDKSTCRARTDCTPIYWQDLGPDDGPVGDIYYKRCDPELPPQ